MTSTFFIVRIVPRRTPARPELVIAGRSMGSLVCFVCRRLAMIAASAQDYSIRPTGHILHREDAETDTRFEICIAGHHPAIAGHFPGRPVVPGALLLGEIVTRLSASGLEVRGLRKVRFSLPVRPAEVVEVECRAKAGQYRFECRVAGETVARGILVARTDERHD